MTAEAAILGAGPAGIAAAGWLAAADVAFDWYEASGEVGGTLRRVGNRIANLPGFTEPDGSALARAYERWLGERRISPAFGLTCSLATREDRWSVETSAGTREYRWVIVATGTRPRLLGIPGESARLGRGVEISVTRNLERYAGRPVVVVGGGDAAAEGATLLTPRCPSVVVVHRGESMRAQRRFVSQLEAAPNVELRLRRTVTAIESSATGAEDELIVVLSDGSRLVCGGVFVRVGVGPNLPAGIGEAARTSSGYLRVEENGRTALPGLFGAGDCTGAAHQSVAWAVGSGARAAAAVVSSREAL